MPCRILSRVSGFSQLHDSGTLLPTTTIKNVSRTERSVPAANHCSRPHDDKEKRMGAILWEDSGDILLFPRRKTNHLDCFCHWERKENICYTNNYISGVRICADLFQKRLQTWNVTVIRITTRLCLSWSRVFFYAFILHLHQIHKKENTVGITTPVSSKSLMVSLRSLIPVRKHYRLWFTVSYRDFHLALPTIILLNAQVRQPMGGGVLPASIFMALLCSKTWKQLQDRPNVRQSSLGHL